MKKNRWETIIPDTERARNEEIATQVFTDLFGATNWKELVLAGQDANGVFADEAIYQGMRQSYGTNSEQQRDTQRQIDINNIITESLTRLVEDFQADKINSEELSAKVSTLMNFVNDGLITGQERLENTLSLGDYSNLGAALTDASRQRNDQMDIFNENLAIAQENRDQVNELIGRWDDFKVWYDETYKQLYEQYKLLTLLVILLLNGVMIMTMMMVLNMVAFGRENLETPMIIVAMQVIMMLVIMLMVWKKDRLEAFRLQSVLKLSRLLVSRNLTQTSSQLFYILVKV